MDNPRVTVPPYSMRLDWDPDEGIFVVSVPELAGCMTHGATYAEAVRNGEEAIASWLGAAEAFGDPIPAPRVVRHTLAPTGD
ncbi:MAG TPA: type II toxin-antitoxin system HicB family antitoxin [Thermomicrobiales bacterium]|jgi:predicted RNase H-like HicB family nuclease